MLLFENNTDGELIIEENNSLLYCGCNMGTDKCNIF